MSVINHIFTNIDAVWDYIDAEEQSKLSKGTWGSPLIVPREPWFPSPRVNPEDIKHLIIPYNDLAYPYSGFFNNASSDKFILCRLKSGRFSLKPNLKYCKFLFRGQPQGYATCKPSLFRDEKVKYYIEEMMRSQELQLLMLNHPLVQLLDIGVMLNGQKIAFEMNTYGLTQHYYNKTSFLDLTSSEDVASFFATNRYDSATDTYEPVTDGIGEIIIYELDIYNDFKTNNSNQGNGLSTIGLQVFPRSGNQRGFLYNMYKEDDFYTKPNVTVVKFKQDLTCSQKYHKLFDGGNGLFPDDMLTRHWQQYNKDSKVLSNNALRLNKICNPKKSIDILKTEIESKGYRIKDYRVEFTEDELNGYYADIKNGFWEQWCSKTFIPGDIDGKMKRDLINLPNHPDYEWAFKPNIHHVVNCNDGFLLNKYKDLIAL